MLGMSDDPFYSPNLKPAPARVARPGELLFEFVRASDNAPMTCELRFNGESYAWEAQFFERGGAVRQPWRVRDSGAGSAVGRGGATVLPRASILTILKSLGKVVADRRTCREIRGC
jgi:hypothetical protein